MSKHIVVVYGGDNSEREVSFASGKEAGKALLANGYKVSYLDPKNANLENILKAFKPDAVFNALHGSFGEDGTLPAILEDLGIPYTHSGKRASSLAWNKDTAKTIAASLGINIPQSQIFKVGDKPSEAALKLMEKPFVIKAIAEGSSCNLQIIFEPQKFALEDLTKLSAGEYLIEEYIAGREVSIGVFLDKVIGAVEIVTKSSFYDYQAKYIVDDNQYIVAPDLDPELLDEICQKTELLHNELGCINISRSDFIFTGDKFYFLEINTHPGLTTHSLLPKIAAKQGIDMQKLITGLVESGLN